MTKKRRSIRVPGFDYTGVGDHFVTVVTYQRQPIFGQIHKGEMQANALGKIAIEEWFKTAILRKKVDLFENEFVLMPNHIHGIVHIVKVILLNHKVAKNEHVINVVSGSLGEIVRAYK